MSDEQTGMRLKSAEGMILLDTIDAEAVVLSPTDERAVVVELGGRVNKSERRLQVRVGMSPGQAGELIAALVVAAQTADPETAVEVEQAIAREQQRRLAIDSEHERTNFSLNGIEPDENGNVPACPRCGNVVANTCYHDGVDVKSRLMSLGKARALYEREHE